MKKLFVFAAILSTLFLTACGSTKNPVANFFGFIPPLSATLNYFAFQPEPLSGFSDNQVLQIAVMPNNNARTSSVIAGLSNRNQFEEIVHNAPKEFKSAYDAHCTQKPVGVQTAGVLPFLGSDILLQVGGVIFDQVFSQITDQITKIQKASVKNIDVKIVAGTNELKWRDIKCILLLRSHTDPESVGLPNEPGLYVLLERSKKGADASTLVPRYVHMNYAMALTGRGEGKKPAKVDLNIAYALHVVDRQQFRPDLHEIIEMEANNFPTMNVPIDSNFNACTLNSGASGIGIDTLVPCRHETFLIPNPDSDASAFSLSFRIRETGTSASIADKAKAEVEALKGVTKPKFDELLQRIAG